MGIFEQFPYTNFHDLNLDWILHAIRSMDKKLDEFVASNVLSYADPIQWDIETQYAKNTVVIDPKTGTAYMSINPVPVGQLLNNKYYWQPIFNYDEIVNTLKKQIAAVQADQHDTIPVAVGRGDLVWVANKLYRLTKSLDAGSKIIENENAVPVTVEEIINDIDARLIKEISDRESADTTITNNLNKEISDRSKLIKADENNNTVIETDNNLIENITGNYTGKFGSASFETGATSWLVKFPDKTVDLHDIEKNKSSFINVLDFGAKGDGITDDTDAFKNAIEYCISNNVGLYVPAVGNWNQEGGYILSATLNIDYPMSFVCAPNVLLNWKNAHLNTNLGTTTGRNGATKYNSGFGINIDYGTYKGHKGYYYFGIVQGDKSYTYPGGTAPSGHYWTGVRVANGDLIDLNIRYLSYWERGILITSDKDYTGNNRINLLVCDDCQTGITFSPANNNAIDVTEFYFNTIGICKYGIVFESDGANSSSWARTNNLRVRGSQIYTEYKDGACLYNTATFEEAIVNADIDIMCLFNNRTQETTKKTGDTSTWYGKCVTGTQTISGWNDTFGAHDSRFNIGVYNGPMTAGQPININIGGWGNEIINKWQKFHGTVNTPALLIMTPSESDFNGGIGGCLPGRTAFVSWTTDKSYVANETVTLYAYAMCLTASGVTPMSIMEVENYGLFDTIIKSDTYSSSRQFFITIKFRTEVAQGYKFDFIVKINDIN